MHVDKLFHKSSSPMLATETAEQEPVEDCGSYGLVRLLRDQAMMVELRKKTGEITAIPYTVIEKLRFNPNDGIIIHALGEEFRIKGRHLNLGEGSKPGLFNGLCRHRITWVQESSRSLGSDPHATLVESIHW